MLDKRLWPNVVYAVILLVICVTVLEIITDPNPNNISISAATVYSLYTTNTSPYSYPINTLPANDYHTLINLHNFTFTMLNLPCNDSNPLLLVLIHTDPKNLNIRNIVRETWGRNTPQVKVLFVIGLVNTTLKVEIDKENEEFGDMIQGSFEDTYRNMTYKHVMVFKYAIYHCPQAKYILKTDDDVFVNMPFMINFLISDLSPFGGSRMLFCTVRKKSLVLRSWRSKWRVSFKEYPAKTYPTYCPGWAILYSPDVVFELYKQAQKTEYFWIDDVHITGTLADKVHLSHVNVENLVLLRSAMLDGFDKPSTFNHSFLYGPPNTRDLEIRKLWEFVKNHDTRISLLNDIS